MSDFLKHTCCFGRICPLPFPVAVGMEGDTYSFLTMNTVAKCLTQCEISVTGLIKNGRTSLQPLKKTLVPNSGATGRGPSCYASFVTVSKIPPIRSFFGQIIDLINY